LDPRNSSRSTHLKQIKWRKEAVGVLIMEYWICITNEENWEIIKESNVWGVSKLWKKTLLKVKPGDHILFYLKQSKKEGETVPSRITGIFEVISEPYTDKKKAV